jgi:hypothetical protein
MLRLSDVLVAIWACSRSTRSPPEHPERAISAWKGAPRQLGCTAVKAIPQIRTQLSSPTWICGRFSVLRPHRRSEVSFALAPVFASALIRESGNSCGSFLWLSRQERPIQVACLFVLWPQPKPKTLRRRQFSPGAGAPIPREQNSRRLRVFRCASASRPSRASVQASP